MNGVVVVQWYWANRKTGALASIQGAAPVEDKADWEVRSGFSVQWMDGSVGCGRAPFATREEAADFLASHPHVEGTLDLLCVDLPVVDPPKRRGFRVRDVRIIR